MTRIYGKVPVGCRGGGTDGIGQDDGGSLEREILIRDRGRGSAGKEGKPGSS